MSVISPPPGRTGWNIALIVSVCLNLVLAGVIAMAVYRFAGHPPPFGHGGPMGGMADRVQVRQIMSPRILSHVAPAKADAIHAAAGPHRARLDPLRAAATAARREVLRLYAAPVFDKPAFDAALAKLQAADAALEIEVFKMASDTAAVLSPEERHKALEWQPRDHGFRDGPHRGGPDGAGSPPPHED